MKSNSFKSFAIFLFIILGLSSCFKDEEKELIYSNNPSFSSLLINGKNTALLKARFTLKPSGIIGADSIIENLDSLPYLTKIDTVIINIKFKSTAASFLFYDGNLKDSIYLDGTDTINFTRKVKIRNYSADGKKRADYQVKVNVHQIDPELYIWRKDTTIDYSGVTSNQKAVMLNSKFYYYLNNGSGVSLYSSDNGKIWSASFAVSSLPIDIKLGNIQVYNNKMYLIYGGDKIYSSSDGKIWSVNDYQPENYTFKSLLFALNGNLWAVTKSEVDNKYRFASSADGLTWLIKGEIPSGFPVSGFTSLSFFSRTGKAKAIVLSGVDEAGQVVKTNWNTENGTFWVDFSGANMTLNDLDLGSALIAYDNKLMLFGKTLDSKNYLMESKDEGLSWKKPDELKNALPSTYGVRNYPNVLVDGSDNIFVIGGETATGTSFDVWRGKLNRKGFIIQ